MNSKKFNLIFILLFSIVSVFGNNVYNEGGSFEVTVNTLTDEVFNNNIKSEFVFNVKNNLDVSQNLDLNVDFVSGWDIDLSEKSIELDAGEDMDFILKLNSNSEFDYTPNVVSPNLIKISQNNEEYSGFFEFPLTISGDDEVVLTYNVNIKPTKDNLKFMTKIQKTDVSPVKPLKFTVNSEAITKDQNVEIFVKLGDFEFETIEDVFSPAVDYKIYQLNVPAEISPAEYLSKVTVRVLKDGGESAQEWYSNENLVVSPYRSIEVTEERGKGLFRDRVEMTITNLGNQDDVFDKELQLGFFSGLLFGTDAENFVDSDNGIKFDVKLAKAETKTFTYSFNFLALAIIILVSIAIAIYIYYRKNSNPLAVKNQLYEVVRDKHEGVKGFKVRIGFENIKESEIDKLKVVFRMPAYLQVEDNSFSLTEPKHALKGDSQYKLVWDFKRFEKGDTRLLGFKLVNNRGILGDVRLPELELEVKINGKTRKYYQSFPVIKG